MATVITETREVYRCEISEDYEMRWFLCHCRRFLLIAQEQGFECEILIGTCSYRPKTFEDLKEIWQEIMQKTARYFKERKQVYCRVIFKSS
jgi:hypothetical protein